MERASFLCGVVWGSLVSFMATFSWSEGGGWAALIMVGAGAFVVVPVAFGWAGKD